MVLIWRITSRIIHDEKGEFLEDENVEFVCWDLKKYSFIQQALGGMKSDDFCHLDELSDKSKLWLCIPKTIMEELVQMESETKKEITEAK